MAAVIPVPDLTSSSFWRAATSLSSDVVLGTVDALGAMWIVSDMQGWFQTPPIQTGVQQLGFRDLSSATTRFPRQARPVTLTGQCFATTLIDLWQARDRLFGAWGDPNTTFNMTVTQPDQAKQLTRCRLNGQIDAPWEPGNPIVGWFQFSYSIPIIALDPLKYSTTPDTANTPPNTFGELQLSFPLTRTMHAGPTSYSTPALAFPFTKGGSIPAIKFAYSGGSSGFASVQNNGNEMSFPYITITGPVNNGWYIQNNATGDQFAVNTAIPVGATLVIDMQNNLAMLGGVVVNAQVQGDWFACPPGENDLQYFAANNDGSNMNVTLYSAWR